MGVVNQDVFLLNKAKKMDPFLVEALQNPRHRLTILRMELDIQKFLQSPEQLQYQFEHFPTSYLRLAAHRVAQHYGLQTMVLENLVDGLGPKIMVIKTPESKYPSVCLSEIPAIHSANNAVEQLKIAIKPRPGRVSSGDEAVMKRKINLVRSMEERKEEYDKARARIFSSLSSSTSDETLSQGSGDGTAVSPSNDDNGGRRLFVSESNNSLHSKDAGKPSRIGILRDREKDLTDPDYDRSYDRYVKSFPTGQRFVAPFGTSQFHPPCVQYEAPIPQMGHMTQTQTSLNYGPLSNPGMSHYCTMGLNQASQDAIYMQWPSPAMIYAHPYEQFRHSVFQAPFYQQPLGFDYSQNH